MRNGKTRIGSRMSLSVQGGNSIKVVVRAGGRKCLRDDMLSRHLKKAGVLTAREVLLAKLAQMGEVHVTTVRDQLARGVYNEDLRMERALEGVLCDVFSAPEVLTAKRQLCFLCQGHRIVNGRCMTCGMNQNHLSEH